MRQTDWLELCLADLVTIKHGFAFKGQYFREEPPGDILLTPGNFAVGGGFKSDKFKYYDGPVPDDYVLGTGDLLVTMTDLSKASDTLGYPALVPPTSSNRRFLHNQRLGKVSPLQGASLDSRYLFYRLCARDYRHEVLAGATGTTVKHTSPNKILSFRFALPPLAEQKAIAHILGTLDDKIELNWHMNRTLEDIARALFKSWFVDFDPVHAKARGEQPAGMDAATAALFPAEFEESELGPIPKGWRVTPIGEVVEAVGGSTPSTKNSNYWTDGTHAFATPKDLSGLQSPILMETERKVTDEGLVRISSGSLPEGTVLMSSRAPVGYLAITQIPVCVNQGFIAMKCQEPFSNYYVLNWCHFNMDVIRSNAGGTTFAEISKRNFRPIPALVPSDATLFAFSERVAPIYGLIANNEFESRTLAELRDTLLPKLMSGELRVPETVNYSGTAMASRQCNNSWVGDG